MLYYDRIDVTEGIDFNKTSESKECDSDYRYIINDISKSKAASLIKRGDFNEKSGTL